jgi:hypothetical protein
MTYDETIARQRASEEQAKGLSDVDLVQQLQSLAAQFTVLWRESLWRSSDRRPDGSQLRVRVGVTKKGAPVGVSVKGHYLHPVVRE